MARHRHIIGQPATGKSSLLVELFERDASPGRCVIDTRGDLEIAHDYLFEPTTTRWNPLAEPIDRDLAPTFFANTIKDAFGYDDLTTPVMSMYLAFVAAALIDNGHNLTDAPRLLTNRDYRAGLAHPNPLVAQFWGSFEDLSERDRRADTASTLNKFLGLLLDGRAGRLLSVNRSGLSLGQLQNKTVLVRLPLAQYGAGTVALIGSLFLSYAAQLLRAPYSLYVEDAHLFAKGTLTGILNDSSLSLTLAHQYLDQLDPKLRAAVLGNCAERFIFRVSQADATVLANDLPPMSSRPALYDLANFRYRCIPYARYDSDGCTSPRERRDEGQH